MIKKCVQQERKRKEKNKVDRVENKDFQSPSRGGAGKKHTGLNSHKASSTWAVGV
jgi:hypothetical protein